MSEEPQSAFERSRAEPERSSVPYARCKKQTGDVYSRIYVGRQRAPELIDEKGAIAVVECVFGGRVRIYRIDGDNEHRRVELDRDWSRPA